MATGFLAPHRRAAAEGINAMQVLSRDVKKHKYDPIKGRRPISKAELIARTEELMPLIADGTIPMDETTAHILKLHLAEKGKVTQE